MNIAIGVFAHDEAQTIAQVLRGIDRQDIFHGPAEITVFVLSNGSTDDTVALAQESVDGLVHQGRFRVLDLPSAGKSLTWNHFVHRLAGDADILICIDADITFNAPGTLRRLADRLVADPALDVTSSWPVKDLATKRGLTLRERLIRLGAGTLDDNRHALCGQLYALRGTSARRVHMPLGLPVEDGFLRAMILTRLLTEPEQLARISCDESVSHVYRSESTILALVRHQIRIVVGSAVNAYLFAAIRATPETLAERERFLSDAAQTEDFVARTLRRATPTRPHGYVPFHFLTKRLKRLPLVTGLSRKFIILVGFGLDLVVFIAASVVMARNKAQGFW